MPLYRYECRRGHSLELLRQVSVEEVECPACGETAQRQSVYSFAFSGFTRTPVDQREVRLGEFQEASAELAYEHERAESAAGRRLPTPPLWRRAKREARRLQGLGIKDSAELG
jgi:putative FmdB family regulatory protein